MSQVARNILSPDFLNILQKMLLTEKIIQWMAKHSDSQEEQQALQTMIMLRKQATRYGLGVENISTG